MRWIVIVLTLMLVACGGDDDDDGGDDQEAASERAVSVAEAGIAGDWAAVYEALHPDQQAVLTQEAFVACRSTLTPPQYEVSVAEVRQDIMTSTGTVDENAWTVELNYLLEGHTSLANNMHIYKVDDDMVWALWENNLATLQAGECDVDPLSASAFALDIAEAEIAGDWATVYAGLHPNQQAIVPQDLFIECRTADTVRATAAAIQGVITESDSAPEIEETQTYAVTLGLTIPDAPAETATLHVYPLDSGFAWALGVASIAAFGTGQCD